MRSFLGAILSAAFLGGMANAGEEADRLDQLFAAWSKAQAGVRSLVVEFTLETKDPNFGGGESFEGTVRLLRTAKGKILASYDIAKTKPKPVSGGSLSALLHGESIYLPNPKEKSAVELKPARGDLLRFLTDWFNPFVALLDRKYAEQTFRLKVVKQDQSYTYLAVTPRPGKLKRSMYEGRIMLMRQASEKIPQDMPRQLWYRDDCYEYTFEIKSWHYNGADKLKPEDLASPRERPGWAKVKDGDSKWGTLWEKK